MTLAELLAQVEHLRLKPQYVKSSLDKLLPEKIKNAKHVIGLVSGEYHAGVYNGSKIVEALKNRFSTERLNLPRIFFVGGPLVLKAKYKSLYRSSSYVNDIIEWLKERLIFNKTKAQVYKAIIREDTHFWFIDEYVTFQGPHYFGDELKNRKTFRIYKCPELVSWLIKYIQKKANKGEFEQLLTVQDLDKYVYQLWYKTPTGERIIPDKETTRKRLLDFLENVPKPTIRPYDRNLSIKHDNYI